MYRSAELLDVLGSYVELSRPLRIDQLRELFGSWALGATKINVPHILHRTTRGSSIIFMDVSPDANLAFEVTGRLSHPRRYFTDPTPPIRVTSVRPADPRQGIYARWRDPLSYEPIPTNIQFVNGHDYTARREDLWAVFQAEPLGYEQGQVYTTDKKILPGSPHAAILGHIVEHILDTVRAASEVMA